MEEKRRKTGTEIIDDVPWGTHICQFYQTKEDLLDILVPYFKAGLENNESCMWITSPPLTKEIAESALRKAVPDLDRYLKENRLAILPYSQWHLRGTDFNAQRVLHGWSEKIEHALAQGFEGLRISGDTSWVEKENWKAFTDYEATANNAIPKHRFLALCTYWLEQCSVGATLNQINK